jgi:hypothetical protein
MRFGPSPQSEEKAMSHTANHRDLAAYVGDPPRRKSRVGILRRVFGALLKAMEESRQKQTEQEIANFVALRGGPLTDDLEREMMRRLLASDWSPRDR